MPPRKGTRSSSRQNAPASPYKLRRPYTRRPGRGDSKDPDASASEETIQIKSKPGKPRKGPRLADVEEDVDSEQLAASDEEESDSDSEPSSSEDTADLEAFQSLDREQIADNLASLYFEAKNLLAMFQTQRQGQIGHILDELKDTSSKASVKLRKLSARLNGTRRESFGGNEMISYDHVVRKVAGLDLSSPQVPLGDWRPDGAVYLANLATALSICLAPKQDQRRITSFLMLLRENFPVPLAPGYVTETNQPFETAILEATQHLIVDLRTQLTIRVFKTQVGKSDFDVGGMLEGLWSTDDETLKLIADQRVTSIREGMRESSEGELGFDQLEADYPWDEFLTHFLTWAQKRATELESQIRAQGGIEKIQERVSQGIEDMLAEPPFGKTRVPLSDISLGAMDQQAIARASLQAPFEVHQSASSFVAALRNNAVSRSSNVGSTTLLNESGSLPASAQINASLSSPDDPSPSQYEIDTIDAIRRQDAERNKENMGDTARVLQSFNAPQAGATRVTWGDTQVAGGPSPRKRAHADIEDDEDAEFETDHRQQKVPQRKKRARLPIQQHVQSPARSTYSATQDDRDAQLSSSAPMGPPPPRAIQPSPARRFPSSSAPAIRQTDPHIDPRIIASQVSDDNVDDDISINTQNGFPSTQEVNARAKAFTRVQRQHINATQQTTPQKRTPWSQDETERLMNLVEAHGTGWSAILKIDQDHPEGPLLQRRGQVGLKDKARNMKMDFLKAGVDLPANFEHVTLGNRYLTLLRELGVGVGQAAEEEQ